jgi:putative oxygen-independent coproporphyrinogen III oxidase
MPASMPEPISIYVHWPFCLSKCPYCDFNSHVRDAIDEAGMSDALQSELEYFAEMVGKRPLKSIFFGGGTPSLMPADTVGKIIDLSLAKFDAADDIEITLEANPTSVEAAKFADFANAGVNRVSLGIQALNDADLKRLGREHSVREALDAIELSQKYFNRSNFDLIYTRMGQSIADWEQELCDAIKIANGHLSLYQLTMEKGTPFYGQWRKGELILPDEDTAAEMYEMTRDICAAAGYELYEISNYAKSGEESRHNLTYWNYNDYIGIGAGAHGRITVNGKTFATEQNKKPETWLQKVSRDGHATKIISLLDQHTMAEEMIMMGLRLVKGIKAKDFERRIGLPIQNVINSDQVALLISQGFVAEDFPDQLQLTVSGRSLLNQILDRILV